MHDYQEVFNTIGYMRANSSDLRFHEYLDKKLTDAELKTDSAENILKDLEYNYRRYLFVAEGMKNQGKPSQENNAPSAQEGPTVPPLTNQKPASTPIYQPASNYTPGVKKISGLEYKIGAGVLSVVGSIFIILGLYFLGKYFLSDIFVGLLIYILGAVVTLLGEFVVWKRNDKLGNVVSGVGFGSLYVAAIVCNVSFDMYNVYIMVAIAALVSVLAFVSGYFHKTVVPELIALVGMITMMIPARDTGYIELFVCGLVGCLVQIAILCLSKNNDSNAGLYSKLSAIFFAFLVFYANFFSLAKFSSTEKDYMLSVIVLVYIAVFFIAIMKYVNKKSVMIYSVVLSAIVTCFWLYVVNHSAAYILAEAVFAALCIVFFLLTFKRKQNWTFYGFFILGFALLYCFDKNEYVALPVALGILIVSKLLLRFKETLIYDCILSVIAMAVVIYYSDNPISYAIIFVLMLGVFLAEQYKIFHEIVVMVGTALFGLVLSIRVDELWVSIVIMAIAFCSIAIGCAKNRFEIRIYGLVISLIVCLKVALYDYRDANELMRMIVFLVVGAIAIGISFVYIIIERHEQNHLKEKQECAIQEPLKQEPLQ